MASNDPTLIELANRAHRGRGEQREAAILAAVISLVGERGYATVTVDAIAARAGASKATIYRRWSSKADLVVDALRRHADGTTEVDLPDTGSLRGDLRAAVNGMEQVITGSSDVSLVRLVDAIRDDAGLRDLIRGQVEDGSRSAALTIVARAISREEMEAGPSRRMAQVLELAFGQVLLRALLSGRSTSQPERDALVDGVLLPMLAHQIPTD
jgi:AcrR family transcriptional regulator